MDDDDIKALLQEDKEVEEVIAERKRVAELPYLEDDTCEKQSRVDGPREVVAEAPAPDEVR